MPGGRVAGLTVADGRRGRRGRSRRGVIAGRGRDRWCWRGAGSARVITEVQRRNFLRPSGVLRAVPDDAALASAALLHKALSQGHGARLATRGAVAGQAAALMCWLRLRPTGNEPEVLSRRVPGA